MDFQKIPPLTMLLVAALALLVGCSPPAPTPAVDVSALATSQPRTVVVDTDIAADDWMAILYLLQRPDVTVRAIVARLPVHFCRGVSILRPRLGRAGDAYLRGNRRGLDLGAARLPDEAKVRIWGAKR